jgi:hypothetical protein
MQEEIFNPEKLEALHKKVKSYNTEDLQATFKGTACTVRPANVPHVFHIFFEKVYAGLVDMKSLEYRGCLFNDTFKISKKDFLLSKVQLIPEPEPVAPVEL